METHKLEGCAVVALSQTKKYQFSAPYINVDHKNFSRKPKSEVNKISNIHSHLKLGKNFKLPTRLELFLMEMEQKILFSREKLDSLM